MLILAVPVDKDSSVSPNIRLHVPSVSLPAARTQLSPGGERVAAPEADLRLAAVAEKSDPVAGTKNNY